MPTDSKKVQTLVNRAGKAFIEIRTRIDELKTLRDLFQAQNPDTTDTPLDGNVPALNTIINNLDTEMQKLEAQAMIDGIQPTHVEVGLA